MRSGGCAGSGRARRPDPSGLPVRFFAGEAAADGPVRAVELHSLTRCHAARAARHGMAQYAGRRFRRHLVVADARRIAVNAYSEP